MDSGWVRIWKGKLCCKTLKVYQVWDKPNLDNIFKSYLGYRDLKSLHNSTNYFKRLQKNLFPMIQQLGLPMFFVTFTSTERLWNTFIKTLHTLYASRLNLLDKIGNLQFVHITKLLRIDPVTCVRYYDHKTSCFCKLITKYHYLFGYIFYSFHHWIPKLWERTWP
jgi:hypothetical protein